MGYDGNTTQQKNRTHLDGVVNQRDLRAFEPLVHVAAVPAFVVVAEEIKGDGASARLLMLQPPKVFLESVSREGGNARVSISSLSVGAWEPELLTFCDVRNVMLSPCSFFASDRCMLFRTVCSDADAFSDCFPNRLRIPSAWWKSSVISRVFMSISRSCCVSSLSKLTINRFVCSMVSSFILFRIFSASSSAWSIMSTHTGGNVSLTAFQFVASAAPCCRAGGNGREGQQKGSERECERL